MKTLMAVAAVTCLCWTSHAAAQSKPRNDPNTWFLVRDYPPKAVKAGAQGVVTWRATVDDDGRITSCTIVASSGNASLDERTCSLVQRRGQFERGKPGTFEWSVTWKLPLR